ncbi:MAG: hypothetical protein LC104_05455 [Bacteroidales bacterium]|nr:hypothetical protein [Bacteroidales bacterium]
MDEMLLRYLLDDLSPAEREAVESRLSDSPDDAVRLQALRRVLFALEEEAEHAPVHPPADLVYQTLARTAEAIVAQRLVRSTPRPSETNGVEPSAHRIARHYREIHPQEFDAPLIPTWFRRVDVAVAACFAVVVGGILLVGLEKFRRDSQVFACQDQMRQVHQSLVSYGDVHMGRYPQVGSPGVPVVREVGLELRRNGHLTGETIITCPVQSALDMPGIASPINYAYTLGYRTANGALHGIVQGDHPEGSSDWVPVAADLPQRDANVHGRGQNILFTGGNVRFSTSPQAGYHGDDIYRNEAGLPRAGLHRNDTSLGQAFDAP